MASTAFDRRHDWVGSRRPAAPVSAVGWASVISSCIGTMEISKRFASLPIFLMLIAVSFLFGWFIPAFYDWTGSDQSRPSPLIGQTAWGMTAVALIVWSVLPWLPIADASQETEPAVRVRFKLRTLFAVTGVAALVIAAITRIPTLVSGGLCVITLCYVVRHWILHPRHRLPITALLACMFLPFVWIVGYRELSNILPTILWAAPGLPSVLPMMIIGRWVGQHGEELFWLSTLLTSAEIVIGVWMIRLGPRRTIAYLVLVLLISTFGSFVLNALLRA